MEVNEVRLGRVFMVRLEAGDSVADSLTRLALDHGVSLAHMVAACEPAAAGMIASDPDGKPVVHVPAAWRHDGELDIVVQELTGADVRCVKDPSSGRETLVRVKSSKTRVIVTKQSADMAPGSGTVPVYLFNAECN